MHDSQYPEIIKVHGPEYSNLLKLVDSCVFVIISIPYIHFISTDFGIEFQKIDRAEHPVLLGLGVDDIAILQQMIHQLGHGFDET